MLMLFISVNLIHIFLKRGVMNAPLNLCPQCPPPETLLLQLIVKLPVKAVAGIGDNVILGDIITQRGTAR